jgi:hypothetical protein
VTSDVPDHNDRTPAVPAADVAGDGEPHADDHGSTPANWTANVLIVVGFLLGTVGVVMGNRVVLWVGVALIPIGLIVGKLLSGMGYGRPHESAAHDQ